MQKNSILYALQYPRRMEMRDILKFVEREQSETTQT